MRVQRKKLTIFGSLLIAWPAVALAQAPTGPCAQITAACLQAGFGRGGAEAGAGLQADCVAPIMQGVARPREAGKPLPHVAAQLVAECRARNPQFGQGNAPVPQAIGKRPIRIMPLGDSITYGTPNPGYGGYRHALQRLLENARYRVEFVGSQHSGDAPDGDNEGHPGWTIAQIKNGIDANRWLETADPDIILLHIGTNDIRLGHVASAPADLSALLDDILERLPRAHVIVARIIPFRRGSDPENQAYNDALARIVASKGARVASVDMRAILLPGDYADALHPNASGYDKMARAWEPAILVVLKSLPPQGAAGPK